MYLHFTELVMLALPETGARVASAEEMRENAEEAMEGEVLFRILRPASCEES